MALDAVVQRGPSLTDTLCTQCGLCCDGTLFADVELTGQAEATRLEILGLEIEDDERAASVLSLPCAALRGTRCGIYAHRPKCCRTFECQLLQDVRRGAVTVARAEEHISEALQKIQRVRELLVQLGQRDVRLPLKERCAEALAGGASASREVNRKRAQLEDAMAGVERTIWQTFLGSGQPQGRLSRRATPRTP
jgi:Fe-S-cluster containining protein